MPFVVMALTLDQWQLCQTWDMDNYSSRILFADAYKATMLKVKELEVQWGLRSNVGGPEKAKAGMNSLGTLFAKLEKKIESMKNSTLR